jgi:predicted HTH domain antitoxin
MSVITIDLDEELAAILYQENQPLRHAARELIVLELYRRGTLSSGKAAQLLGMSRWTFIHRASQLGIPFFSLTEDEWESERVASEML